jgi:carbon storage regulator
MLVLQRKVGESIHIGQDIEIVVLQVSGGRTRLGFRCPGDVPIRRCELPVKGGAAAAENLPPTAVGISPRGQDYE